jgi:spoIIIJ-associated protein
MSGIFSKLFGGKKKTDGNVETLIQETLEGLFERGQFDLNFDLKSEVSPEGESQILIEMSGDDEELMKEREGQLIDALQLFLQRVVQHHLPEDRTKISIDCGGYREESNQALVDLAEKLKGIALEKGKSVYFRALPPKDRKVIHQYLSTDDRVRSRSIGDGLYKKIKIYPVKNKNEDRASMEDAE